MVSKTLPSSFMLTKLLIHYSNSHHFSARTSSKSVFHKSYLLESYLNSPFLYPYLLISTSFLFTSTQADDKGRAPDTLGHCNLLGIELFNGLPWMEWNLATETQTEHIPLLICVLSGKQYLQKQKESRWICLFTEQVHVINCQFPLNVLVSDYSVLIISSAYHCYCSISTLPLHFSWNVLVMKSTKAYFAKVTCNEGQT